VGWPSGAKAFRHPDWENWSGIEVDRPLETRLGCSGSHFSVTRHTFLFSTHQSSAAELLSGLPSSPQSGGWTIVSGEVPLDELPERRPFMCPLILVRSCLDYARFPSKWRSEWRVICNEQNARRLSRCKGVTSHDTMMRAEFLGMVAYKYPYPRWPLASKTSSIGLSEMRAEENLVGSDNHRLRRL
jgi:hypothetical protein